jgi:hypothetical protein
MMAQVTRAILFAKATATTSRSFRPRSDTIQGSALAIFEQSNTVCALLITEHHLIVTH